MRAAWDRWVALWDETEPPVVLALMRILVGLVIFSDIGSMLWTPSVDVMFVDDAHGGLAADGHGPWWFPWVGGASTPIVRALLVTTTLLAGALTVGIGGRLTPMLLIWLLLGVFSMHGGTGGGHDRVITNACWLLVIGPSTATWSVDAWRRTGRWHDPTPIRALARRLAIFQLVLMYTITGMAKQGDAWFARGDLTAVYRALLNPSWSRYDLAPWLGEPWAFWLTQIGTRVSWVWEATWLLLGLHLVLRRPAFAHTRLGRLNHAVDLRLPWVLGGIATHGTLWVLMDLGPFSAITLSLYVALLRPEDRIVRWLDGLGRRP